MKAEATRFGQEVLSYGGLRASRKEYRETLWFVALVCCFGNSGDRSSCNKQPLSTYCVLSYLINHLFITSP